jgi:5-methylcytosine-specific restriction endonuclease McrA
LSYGLSAPVLVLNRNYQPVRVTTARHAFTMMYLGRAHALSDGYESLDFAAWLLTAPTANDEVVGTPSGFVRVPRLLHLLYYNRVPQVPVRLSRRNVLLRDDYRCQYCSKRPHPRDLNLDHVVPRSRGGRSTWENLVTSCRGCNLRKGRHLPAECGMTPLREPFKPAWNLAARLLSSDRRFVEWEPFLGTHVDDEVAVAE